MKRVKLICFVASMVLVNSYCNKKYLDKQPLGLLEENALANKKGVEGLLIGAYSLLDGVAGTTDEWYSAGSNWIYGSICGSEAYTGSEDGDLPRQTILPLEKFAPTNANTALAIKWATIYNGVRRTNDVLRVMAKAKDIIPKDQARIAGEARFLRAHYHFEAKKMWGNIPFIDETVTYENGNYHVANDTAWLPIEKDLIYAIDSLPFEQNAIGRANKYTAMALLAKVYMFQRRFPEAKLLLEPVINSGKYDLDSNFHENFNPETRNSKESVFSVQMSVNDGSAGLNGNYGDVLNFPYNGGPGQCCGYFSPSQYLVNHFKTTSQGIPDLINFNAVNVTSDEGFDSSDPSFVPYGGFLDPRLDWTIGRRGIPFLDWGKHPGKAWTRSDGGPYSPKKNTYSKSQQTRLTDASFWSNGTTTNNLNLIRFADVLLWAAEIEIEIGSFEKAREYINKIRRRAKTSDWVKNEDGSFAANYKIEEYNVPWINKDTARLAVRYERMLELAMEGHRFFDLVRWNIADTEITNYLREEKDDRNYLVGAVFIPGKHERFPIPQIQIDLSAGADGIPKMIQNPGY